MYLPIALMLLRLGMPSVEPAGEEWCAGLAVRDPATRHFLRPSDAKELVVPLVESELRHGVTEEERETPVTTGGGGFGVRVGKRRASVVLAYRSDGGRLALGCDAGEDGKSEESGRIEPAPVGEEERP